MKIINKKGSQEKIKYEIYDMYLNQEKARRYREEQAKKIQFYRLNVGIIPESDFMQKANSYQQTKTICELSEIPISDKKIIYGDDYKLDASSPVTLVPYYNNNLGNATNTTKYGNKQQKEFLEKFIEQGLVDYHLTPRCDWDLNSYIFLNPFIEYAPLGTHGYSDNFVYIPHAIMALEIIKLYLLETDFPDETLFYYTDHMHPKEIASFSENLHFNKEETITKEHMENLMNSDLEQKELLTRKIKLGSILKSYIK